MGSWLRGADGGDLGHRSPVAQDAVPVQQWLEHRQQRGNAAGMVEVLQGEGAGWADTEDLGVFSPMPANRWSPRDTPTRRQWPQRWMNSLVEPPEAANTHRALSRRSGSSPPQGGYRHGSVPPPGRRYARPSRSGGIDRRHHRRARQRHTENLGGDRHRSGGTHDVADPDGGGEHPFGSSHSSSSMRPMMRSGARVQTSDVTTGRPWN